MNDRSSYFPSLISFVAGSLAGAGIALLMAPQSGNVTRAMLRRKLNETADSARHLKDGVVRRGQDIRNEAAHRVTDAASALAGHAARQDQGQNGGVITAPTPPAI